MTNLNKLDLNQEVEFYKRSIKRIIKTQFQIFDINDFLDSIDLPISTLKLIFQRRVEMTTELFNSSMVDLFRNLSTFDKRIEIQESEFEISVPEFFDYNSIIDSFNDFATKSKETYLYNQDLSDKNYSNTSYKLKPGEKCKIKFFKAKESIDFIDCLEFLKSQEALLVGPQGLIVAFAERKEIFPKGCWVFSLDERDSLWKDHGGFSRVPAIGIRADKYINYDLHYLDGTCSIGDIFIGFFTDKNE